MIYCGKNIIEYFLFHVNKNVDFFLIKGGGKLLLGVIEKWCKENNTSISALEKSCGFGNATIRSWIKSMPRIDTLQKVSLVTGIPIEKLLEDEPGNEVG